LRAALHYAAEAGHTRVVASLVIAGCGVGRPTGGGWGAAHLAAHAGHAQVLEKLLLGGLHADAPAAQGAWTPLHLAARHGRLEVFRLAVSHTSQPPMAAWLLHVKIQGVVRGSVHGSYGSPEP
jgi:ankyrin repeat protein